MTFTVVYDANVLYPNTLRAADPDRAGGHSAGQECSRTVRESGNLSIAQCAISAFGAPECVNAGN
jgi:hypothetical protein